MKILKSLKYDKNGLIPAIIQDVKTGKVLMFAFMNEESLKLTYETKYTHFWSRSRQKLWKKGETSGHVQKVEEIRVDCDRDAVLILVEQTGGACHTGYESCFYETVTGEVKEEKVFDPNDVY
ncbi:MAG: phosphoribosyl-AMP cyclohydrolase [Methanosarcinaceae archaeon]|nr:phosphoribosyl-AMP cyclohydrolase [Methanosarcinaceae archaeon]